MLGLHVDSGNPVNDHPINSGLAGWWLPLPNTSGGSRLFDLKGGSHGTVTAADGWATGPGGSPLLAVPVNCGRPAAVTPAGPLTAAFTAVWFNDGSASDRSLVSWGQDNGGSGKGWSVTVIGNTGEVRFLRCGQAFHATGFTAAAGVPFRVVLSISGASSDVYINGVSRGSFSNSFIAIAAGDPFAVRGLYDGSAFTGNYNGGSCRVGDVRLYPAARPELAAGLYQQSAAGHPDTLRRWSRKTWLLGGVAAGGGGGGNRRRRVLLTGAS